MVVYSYDADAVPDDADDKDLEWPVTEIRPLERDGSLAPHGQAGGLPDHRPRRIMIINPNTTVAMTEALVKAASLVVTPGTTLVAGTPKIGVESVESQSDEVWASAGVVDLVIAGEQEGIDAYVIACFGDTGLAAAKELASGPVVGMTEAALSTAAVVAHRFCVVTMPRRTRVQSDRVIDYLGLGARCTVRAIDQPVATVHRGADHLLDQLAAEANAALTEDGAEAIVLGCAGLGGLVDELQKRLQVPVIDGVNAALTMAEGLLRQGLTTSRRSTFARPERNGPSPR